MTTQGICYLEDKSESVDNGDTRSDGHWRRHDEEAAEPVLDDFRDVHRGRYAGQPRRYSRQDTADVHLFKRRMDGDEQPAEEQREADGEQRRPSPEPVQQVSAQ